ncbi:ImmA/IrrE family metallo-endopeptidase [Candidatus Protofrankia californiensis]|uniref:ImmA/IrrE family metallo-endopeptidase n=1 Tax=Candidatus Protofrankia californiensis TaxID=1839754 RepID=UPI0010415D20|nr:ImmA/IrrE family metallo-endopeptidase [Candidatus Protofrankia californiensis]
MKVQTTSIIRQLRALVPVRPLTEREAKSLAERQAIILLELLGQHRPAVDVGLIAELPRIEVRVEPNLHKGGISGFSQWSQGRWLIVVNRSDSTTRRRFTLSHELKHILDHPFAKVLYSNLSDAEAERERIIERICDYFAGCLLVPRNWLKQAWANGIQDRAALAALFNVSEAAISVRLQQTGIGEPRTAHHRELSQPISSYFRKESTGQTFITYPQAAQGGIL